MAQGAPRLRVGSRSRPAGDLVGAVGWGAGGEALSADDGKVLRRWDASGEPLGEVRRAPPRPPLVARGRPGGSPVGARADRAGGAPPLPRHGAPAGVRWRNRRHVTVTSPVVVVTETTEGIWSDGTRLHLCC